LSLEVLREFTVASFDFGLNAGWSELTALTGQLKVTQGDCASLTKPEEAPKISDGRR
jgi:hypothetical protein